MNGTPDSHNVASPVVVNPVASKPAAGRPARIVLRMACYAAGAFFALLSVLHLTTASAMILKPMPENGPDMLWMVPAITLSSAVAGAIAAVACMTVGRKLR